MTQEEFKKEFFNHQPAIIKATLDADKKNVSITVKGRNIDAMSLSMVLAQRIIEMSHMSVDDYCHILKEGMMSQDNELFRSMFGDLFDGQGRTDFD